MVTQIKRFQMETDAGEVLSPRLIPYGPNQVYVYLALSIYGKTDAHAEVRTTIWKLLSHKLEESPNDAEACLYKICNRRDLARTWAETPAKLIAEQMAPRTPSPLELVFPLAAECYGIGIILYGDATRAPLATWNIEAPVTRKFVHFLRYRNGFLEMLVPSRRKRRGRVVHDSLEAQLIPNHPVLNLSPSRITKSLDEGVVKKTMLSEVAKHARYHLHAYDPRTRKNYKLASFYSPDLGLDPEVKVGHYLWIDPATADKSWQFVIDGCQSFNENLFIYALSSGGTSSPTRVAQLIAYWRLDLCSPTIDIRQEDDCIIIVPCPSPTEASQIVASEFKCRILAYRPIEGAI